MAWIGPAGSPLPNIVIQLLTLQQKLVRLQILQKVDRARRQLQTALARPGQPAPPVAKEIP